MSSDYAIPKFICEPGCGYCCRISPITVFPHEVHILRRLAEKFDVVVRFRPGYRVADLVHRVRIVLTYVMELDPITDRCPFLEEDYRCLIHNVYKPVTCRAFPRVPKVIQYIVDKYTRRLYFMYEIGISKVCPVVKRLYDDYTIRMLIQSPELAKSVMPEEYKACREFLVIRGKYLELLTLLWRNGQVELSEDLGYPWPMVDAYSFIRQFYPEITIRFFTDLSTAELNA